MEEGFYYKNDYLKKRNKRYISALLENTLTRKSIIFHEMLIPAKKKPAIRPYGEWVSIFKLLRTSFWNRTHRVAHSFFRITS